MTEYNEAILRELDQQLWHLLSPVEEISESGPISKHLKGKGGLLSRDANAESRPLSGVTDITGRKLLYDLAHQAPPQDHKPAAYPTDQNENIFFGESVDGLPHGQGAKKYTKPICWDGILLPYGCILEKGTPVGPGSLISTERYALELGVLQRFGGGIVFTDGKDIIESYEHCSKILERLRYIQKYGAIGLILVCKNTDVLNNIASEAMFSAMLEHFTIPVIGVTKSEFEFQPRNWPHPSLIESKFVGMMASPPSLETLEDVGSWVFESSQDMPMSLQIIPKGKHFRDKRGCFPTEPVGILKVTLLWSGTELYIGNFRYGKKHGIGAFVRANGEKLVIHFENGYAHGKGYLYWPNGDMFLGTWIHGKQVGHGEIRTRRLVGAAQVIQKSFKCHVARRLLRKYRMRELSKRNAKRQQM